MTNTSEKKIMIKSKFFGWKESTYENALDYAKWKFKAIYMGRNKEDYLLSLINSSLQGVKFNSCDLR